MPRVILAIVLATLVMPAARQRTALSAAEWKADVEYFARELPKRHGNAFHALARAEFLEMVNVLLADLPKLPHHSVPIRLLMITARIGDAHTSVRLPQSVHRLPVVLHFFGEDLRVAATTADTQDLFGARVVAVGGVPIADVIERVGRVASQHENRWFLLGAVPGYLVITEILQTLGLSTTPDAAEVTFDVNGQVVTRLLRGSLANELQFTERPGAAISRQRTTEPFWFAPVPEQPTTLYVSFRSYTNFESHSRVLMRLVDADRPRRLVIDLRQNTGGDYTKVREHLIPGLRQRQYVGPDRLFVITGRRTLSAAMNNAADFRRELKAMLVGEPPGERPNSWQENDTMTLPRSKLQVSYSTKSYKFVDEDVDALMPDHLIAPDWESFAAGRDPILEWIVSQ